MVKVKINNNYIKLEGHAGFHNVDVGYDLVCCAISVLTSNLINSLINLSESEIDYKKDNGIVEIDLKSLDNKGSLFIASWKLGLEAINKEYNCISFNTQND